ncbi:MAG: carbohydrate ABC transporter permease [Clostridia bacterium]|nr:carbohydrate ABC transporter permease [Clostridia bacterium]
MKIRNRLKHSVSFIVLAIGALVVALPFIWMILTAVKPSNEVLLMPPKWFPSTLVWENFVTAYHAAPFKQYLANSIFVSICITAGEIATAILAAFAFSHLKFRGKQALFIGLIGTMMVPSEILIIPNYMTLSHFGWINSYKALILPWCTSIFSIFLLRQQFSTIPVAYYKAARLDGCSDFQYLWTILVPMSMPTIFSIGILKFINSWNAYLWPLIVTNTVEMRTLPVALAVFSNEGGVHYNTLMAFSLMIILPIFMLYLLLKQQIIKGVGRTGLKG